jgi:hypothetical protein
MATNSPYPSFHRKWFPDLFFPLRFWFDHLSIANAFQAHLVCLLIPASCPFARKIQFRGRTLFQIPPLCKLNPLYDEFMGLRFRALTYLSQ